MVTPIHVYIMCQGDQKRLGDSVKVPKQLLPLTVTLGADELRKSSRARWARSWSSARRQPSSTSSGVVAAERGLGGGDSIQILERTRLMATRLLTHIAGEHRIVIVGGVKIAQEWHGHSDGNGLPLTKIQTDGTLTYLEFEGEAFKTGLLTLRHPGNSSIKGIQQVLRCDARAPWDGPTVNFPPRVIVLLGDVVYSWTCLEALFAPIPATDEHFTARDIRFVGTGDLSPSAGEIFGVALGNGWHTGDSGSAMDFLNLAVACSPKEEHIYQPGQVRRWYKQANSGHVTVPSAIYQCVDDYTDDVDLPVDVTGLPELAALAHADDLEHKFRW